MTTGPDVWLLMADLSPTGVPILTARLLAWLDAHHDARVHVIALHGGAAEATLRVHADTVTVLEPTHRRSPTDALSAALRESGRSRRADAVNLAAWRRRVRHLPRPDVVLVNGAGGYRLLGVAPPDASLAVHLHELAVGLDRSIPVEDRAALFARAGSVLVVSEPVRRLARDAGAANDRIVVVPGVAPATTPVARSVARSALTATGTGPGPVVAGAGVPGWRKATDRFVAVAHEVRRRRPDAEAHWVGGAPDGHDAYAVGADTAVRWHDRRDDPWTLLAAADVLLVPSREDPLPLVALEAGHHGVAVVAADSGGLVDLLADGRGVVVPGHDLAATADAVDALLGDPATRSALGDALRDHVAANHRAEVVGPRWWDALLSAHSD